MLSHLLAEGGAAVVLPLAAATAATSLGWRPLAAACHLASAEDTRSRCAEAVALQGCRGQAGFQPRM